MFSPIRMYWNIIECCCWDWETKVAYAYVIGVTLREPYSNILVCCHFQESTFLSFCCFGYMFFMDLDCYCMCVDSLLSSVVSHSLFPVFRFRWFHYKDLMRCRLQPLPGCKLLQGMRICLMKLGFRR